MAQARARAIAAEPENCGGDLSTERASEDRSEGRDERPRCVEYRHESRASFASVLHGFRNADLGRQRSEDLHGFCKGRRIAFAGAREGVQLASTGVARVRGEA